MKVVRNEDKNLKRSKNTFQMEDFGAKKSFLLPKIRHSFHCSSYLH